MTTRQYALTLLLLALAALLLASPVSRLLRSSRLLAFATVAAVGLVLVATLTPGGYGGVPVPWHIGGLLPVLPDRVELSTVNQVSLNVALFVPLGICAALLTRPAAALAAVALAATTPFAIELTQYAIPELHRVGLQGDDIGANLLGLGAGVIVGLALRLVLRPGARRGRPSTTGAPSS